MNAKTRRGWLLALALIVVAAVPASAQTDYPNRTIRIVVGFAAGGGNDIFARLIGAKLRAAQSARLPIQSIRWWHGTDPIDGEIRWRRRVGRSD